MSVATYEAFMLPTLRALADGQPRSTRATSDAAADLLGLSQEARDETIPSGLLTYVSRAQWAQTYLVQAGLLTRPKRGIVTLTDAGRTLLAEGPDRVDSAFLRRYPSFVDFVSRKQTTADSRASVTPDDAAVAVSPVDVAPDELIANAEHTGRSGDEGIDGIIHRDALGLDRVYLQAKRYTENAVGPEAINAFFGALQRKGADRGVFITSSTFTAGARAAEEDFRSIVLIDGPMLARLMVDHSVGVQVASTHVLKRLDQDYFDAL